MLVEACIRGLIYLGPHLNIQLGVAKAALESNRPRLEEHENRSTSSVGA